MMTIQETHNYPLVYKILTNPILYALTNGQTQKLEDFQVDSSYRYLLIKTNEHVLGCFQIKDFTHITAESHVHILPEFHGKGYSKEMSIAFHDWLKENTAYKTTLVTAPLSCIHVHKCMQKIGYKVTGKITNGIIYNNQIQDLIIYSHSLIGDEQCQAVVVDNKQ